VIERKILALVVATPRNVASFQGYVATLPLTRDVRFHFLRSSLYRRCLGNASSTAEHHHQAIDAAQANLERPRNQYF